MSVNEDSEIIYLSERIFDLFKNRTDGANTNVDDIHWKAVSQWALASKVSEVRVFEAFRRLEKLGLIMPSPGQPDGYYRLTSSGQTKHTEDLIGDRLRTKYLKAASKQKWKVRFTRLFLTCVVLWTVGWILASQLSLIALFQPYISGTIGAVALLAFIAAAASSLGSREEGIFLRFFESYLSIKAGMFARAEKLVKEAADTLQYPREFSRSDWKVISKDVRLLVDRLGQQVRKRMLPAIVGKDARVLRKSVELADCFAHPSLEQFATKAPAVLLDLHEAEYRRGTPTRWEGFTNLVRTQPRLRFVVVTLISIGLVLGLYFYGISITHETPLPTAITFVVLLAAVAGVGAFLDRFLPK